MDSAHGGEPAGGAGDGSDWRAQLLPEARSRIVNKIMETLKKHLPVSVPEGLSELRKIAVRFEEKMYTAAISQSDYLRKISLKMLSLESQSKTNIQGSHQNGVIQNQSPVHIASSGSTRHTGYPGAGDLKDLYQMNKTLKDQYLAGLGALHEISMKLHRDNHVPPQKPANLHEEANFKGTLERSLHSLQINKNRVQLCLEENTPMYKKQITSILNSKDWTSEETFHHYAVQDSSTSSTCEKN